MAWVKLDDGFPDHWKLAELGPYAPLCGWLYVCGLAYCNRQLTDGRIPKTHIKRLAGFDHLSIETGEIAGMASFGASIGPDLIADMLVRAGLWEDGGTHYQVHDYLTYQPSRESVLAERAKTIARQARWKERRDKAKREGDTVGDTVANTVTNAVTNAVSDAVSNAVKTGAPIPIPIPKNDLVPNRSGERVPPQEPRRRRPDSLVGKGEVLRFDEEQQRLHARCHREVCTYWTTEPTVRLCLTASQVAQFAGKLLSLPEAERVPTVIRWAQAHVPNVAELPANLFRYWDEQWDLRPAAKPKRSAVPSPEETLAMIRRAEEMAGR